jgi:hypothetical protein
VLASLHVVGTLWQQELLQILSAIPIFYFILRALLGFNEETPTLGYYLLRLKSWLIVFADIFL